MKSNSLYRAMVLLIALVVVAPINSFATPSSIIEEAFQQSKTKTTFVVLGNCGSCKQRIEQTAYHVEGVSNAKWSIKSKELSIEYNPSITTIDKVQKALADAGHDTPKYKAKDATYNNLPMCCQYKREEITKKENSEVKKVTIRVEGKCGMCKQRIEGAVNALKGVSKATWNTKNKMLHLEYTPSIISLSKIRTYIAEAGHDNGKFKASDEVYNKLPGCCKYRK